MIEHLANLLLVVCLPIPHAWEKRKTYIASKGGVFERLRFISDVSGWFSIRLSLCLSFHSNLTWRMFIHLISYNSYTTNKNSPDVLNQLNIYQCSTLLHNNLFFLLLSLLSYTCTQIGYFQVCRHTLSYVLPHVRTLQLKPISYTFTCIYHNGWVVCLFLDMDFPLRRVCAK